MNALLAIAARDLRLAWGRGGIAMPVAFFLLVATLFPFAVGPDTALLQRTGGGVLWIAALLAALLPVDRLLEPDFDAGVLDHYAVRGISDEAVAMTKLVAHWLGFGPPLMLAAIPAAALLKLDSAMLLRLELGLLIGTPGLAALTLMAAGLTLGLRGGGALGGLLILPLAVPILIFGAGSLAPAGTGGLKLLAALSLLFVAGLPFALAAAMRAARQ